MAPERVTREDLLAEVAQTFPDRDVSLVMDILEGYGVEPHERERERVQRAILRLSRGDVDLLRHNVAVAKQDYRDVLYWSEYSHQGAPSNREDIERLIRHIGKSKAREPQA